jgi:hypothetical protein
MKFQDQYPFDEFFYGFNNVYHPVGYRSHFINSDCIQTSNKIVTTGKKYRLATTADQEPDRIVQNIRLIEVLFIVRYLNMFVTDLESHRSYIIEIDIKFPEKPCEWVIFDWDDYEKINDFKVVASYCNKGDNEKKNRDDGSNAEQSNDDLFEFDF